MQLEQREVRPLGQELADDAQPRKIRVQGPLVENKAGANGSPQLAIEVRNVKLVAGGTDDRHRKVSVDPSTKLTSVSLTPAIAGRHVIAPSLDLREVILTERQTRDANVRVGLGAPKSAGLPAARSIRSR